MKKPRCPRCDDIRMIVIQKYVSTSRIGFEQFAIPCPVCRPHLQPKPVFDGKMAAAGDTDGR